MSISAGLLPELENEFKTTRTLLAIVPTERADWKPHEKSMSLGKLAIHVATLPGWCVSTINATEMDLAPKDGPPVVFPSFESTEKMLEGFDETIKHANTAIGGASDADFMVDWTLKAGDRTFFTMPRVAVVRTFAINHLIHHRGQLSVYLRMLDIPLPMIYGPTADTPM